MAQPNISVALVTCADHVAHSHLHVRVAHGLCIATCAVNGCRCIGPACALRHAHAERLQHLPDRIHIELARGHLHMTMTVSKGGSTFERSSCKCCAACSSPRILHHAWQKASYRSARHSVKGLERIASESPSKLMRRTRKGPLAESRCSQQSGFCMPPSCDMMNSAASLTSACSHCE